jgi:hypothetical protein
MFYFTGKRRKLCKLPFKNGVLAYQKGDLMIVPVLPHHMQFRWAGIIIGIIGFLIIGWTIYKGLKHGDYEEYISLLMLFVFITLMLWFLTLSALSVPLFIPVFILALVVPTALTFYFTYATIRAVYMTVVNA